MKLAVRFWISLAAWSGVLLVLLAGLSLVTGQSAATVAAHLPVWAGLALALASFPAGIAVAFQVFPGGRVSWRQSVTLFAAAAAASASTFVLGNGLGPRLAGSFGETRELHESASMGLAELRAAIETSVELAEAAPAADAADAWQHANALVWNYVRRTDGAALPFLFALVGVLAGFWAPKVGGPQLTQLQLWALGLFLLTSTYLAGENSYELLVMRSAGPVYFAADLVLIVPLVLVVGLGWPTLIAARRPTV